MGERKGVVDTESKRQSNMSRGENRTRRTTMLRCNATRNERNKTDSCISSRAPLIPYKHSQYLIRSHNHRVLFLTRRRRSARRRRARVQPLELRKVRRQPRVIEQTHDELEGLVRQRRGILLVVRRVVTAVGSRRFFAVARFFAVVAVHRVGIGIVRAVRRPRIRAIATVLCVIVVRLKVGKKGIRQFARRRRRLRRARGVGRTNNGSAQTSARRGFFRTPRRN